MTNEDYCNICVWLIDNRNFIIDQYKPDIKNFKIQYSFRTSENSQVKLWQRSKMYFMSKLKDDIKELKPELTIEDVLILIEDPYIVSIIKDYYLEDLLWV